MKEGYYAHMKLSTSPSFGIRFALVVSLLLTILKVIIGSASGSLAILGSALDSLLDMFVSGVNAVALKLSERMGTRKYAYGLGKVQGFAAVFEGVIVLVSGALLGYGGVMSFIAKKTPAITAYEIVAMILAIVGTSIIMWNFLRIAKVNNSLLIKSDALHYSSDLVMNGGILIALILTKYFSLWWTDSIFAIGIAVWIVWNALPIIWSGISMLLDRALEESEIQEIETILRDESSIDSHHYLKTRRSGDDVFIEAHIVFRDKDISLKSAHDISEVLESALGARFPGAHITLHLDVDDAPELCDIRTKTC